MFLKMSARRNRFESGERGSAIIAVIGIAAVIMMFVGVSGSLLVGAMHFTDTTRAGVQAQAAAAAGIVVAQADLMNGVCTAPYTSSASPAYTVTVSYQLPDISGTTWYPGCPTNNSDLKLVKIVSVGSGTAFAPITKTVETIFNYVPAVLPQPVQGTGPGVYGYQVLDPTITNLTIKQQGSSKPGIMFANGSMSCQSGGYIQGTVILGGGSYSTTSACTINGDVYASNTVSIGNNSSILGNVIADGVNGGYSVTLAKGSSVQGYIVSEGPDSIGDKVGGSITAGPVTGTTVIKGAVGGSIVSAGAVSVGSGGSVAGSIKQNQGGMSAPVLPVTVPPWVDFAYNPAAWVDTTGAFYTVVNASDCASDVAAKINAATGPTIVNALGGSGCNGGAVSLSGLNLTLKADVALFANSYQLKSQTITSSTPAVAASRRLWMITPDAVLGNQVPDCPAGAVKSQVNNQVVTDSSVDMLLYSPCGLGSTGSSLWGQVYTSDVKFDNSFTLNFVPVGLPGWNLDTGLPTSFAYVPGHLDSVFSSRNITG
jgi:cytoskeletal protein CcmA (bactofilin family)